MIIAGIYPLKVNKGNTKTICEICSKVNLEQVSHVALPFSTLTLNKSIPARIYPAGNYMLKVNNGNTRTRCEIYSMLTIKTPERRQCFYC